MEINGYRSDFKEINNEVLQGTVLGSQLFNIYSDDFFNIHTKGHLITYADDTAIFYQHENRESPKVIVKKDFRDNILDFFNYKYLSMNVSRTYFLRIYMDERVALSFDKLQITRDITIPFCHHIQYLGVLLDSQLKWDKHVDYVAKKLNFLIYKMKNLRDFSNINSLKILYQVLVEPHLRYGILAWGGICKTHMNVLHIY